MRLMKLLFEKAKLIDGLGGVVERGWVLVEDGTIRGSGPGEPPLRARVRADPDGAVLDLSGKTILPGLIDAHVHLVLDASPDPFGQIKDEPPARSALRIAAHARRTLRAGITTVRDLGDRGFAAFEVRNAIASGLIPGPRMVCAGHLICMTGGHGWMLGREADGVDGVRRAAREQLKAGADVVKLMATGGVLTPGTQPGATQLTREELEAGVGEAHRAGRKAAAHAQGAEGIRNAVRAGVDSVEHGIYLTDEIIETMLERGTYLVPTMAALAGIVEHGEGSGIPRSAVEKANAVRDAHAQSVAKAAKAGVKIAMGTDAGTPFNGHGDNACELALLVRHGLSAGEAIVAATSSAADLLGVGKEVGSISAGKVADLLVVDGDPLANISILGDAAAIHSVYQAGRLV
jgi:imidazolonepropionase-like amidohydrolase